jgi:hypothetical protein
VRYFGCEGKAVDLSVWVKQWGEEGFSEFQLYRWERDWESVKYCSDRCRKSV